MCDTMQHLYSSNRDNIIWIGDRNLPDINWKTDQSVDNRYPVPISQTFNDIFRVIGCQQVIDFLTRQNNTLDIFVTHVSSLFGICTALFGLRDHDIILIDNNVIEKRRRPVRRLIHIWSKANTEGMFNDSKTIQVRETTLPTNTLLNEFKSNCTTTIIKHEPLKYTSNRYSQPW